jgi:hypothetical protein
MAALVSSVPIRRRSTRGSDGNYPEIYTTTPGSATRDPVNSASTGLGTGRGDSPAGTTFHHMVQKWG